MPGHRPARRPVRHAAPHSILVVLTLAAASLAARPAPDGLHATAPPGVQAGPEHTLYFVMNDYARTADHGATDQRASTALGELFDTNVAAFTPRLGPSAVKVHASHEFNVIVAEPAQIHGGDLDALGVRHLFRPAPKAMTTRDLVFSTELSWGTASDFWGTDGQDGALDGTLFSLDRTWNGAELLVRHFLREALVLVALGQPPAAESGDVDIDAFAQDEHGNIFLSFRDDELVNGLLLADDGVVAVAAYDLGYNSLGNIIAVTPGSAVIVLDKPRVDGLVEHAGLTTAGGPAIHTLGDLQALAIDPLGGHFEPVQPIHGMPLGAPHLFFNGQRVGATVLSTRDGGSIAQLDGHRLGSPILNGGGLGLDGPSTTTSGHDLNALLVRPWSPPGPCIDVSERTVDLPGDVPTFLLGNFEPHGWAWVLVSGMFPEVGILPQPGLAPVWAGYPHLYLPQAVVELPVAVDGHGRAVLEAPIVAPPAVGLWIVIQAFEVSSGRLSPPAAVWCPS